MIRSERAGDEPEITALITKAFVTAPHSSGTEAKIVEGLRAAGALAVSLVAEREGRIVGHIAFSPVSVASGEMGWFGLGPVAVLPECQRTGFGASLIESGLAKLRQIGAKGCVVLGEPEYYGRFGFRADKALSFPGPPPEYFQALRFADDSAHGEVRYHRAFSA